MSPFDADKPRDNQDTTGGFWTLCREDFSCVFQRDPAARSRLEVLTTYPGLHALISHRMAHWLWRRNLRYGARLVAYLARLFTHIEIHPAARIGRRCFIDHGTGVVIGETAELGNDVTLYHGVTLGGTSWSKGKRHPTLGHGVIVGAGAKILGPIKVGDGAKIGANSVIIEPVPPHRTAVGIPGKVVKAAGVASLNPYGVDLNHHLIPDPVATSLAHLILRIEQLEAQVAQESPLPTGRERRAVNGD